MTFGVDHIVSGVAINILGAGVTRYLSRSARCRPRARAGGSPSSRRRVDADARPVTVPGLVRLARPTWRSTHWFLVSDLAGILRGLTHERVAADDRWPSLLVAADLLRAVAHRLRPAAALVRREPVRRRVAGRERLPVQVHRRGHLRRASPASAARSSSSSPPIYQEGQTGGRGFIGLAAMIFGNWRPGGLAAGRRPVRLRRRACSCAAAPTTVHALLLLVAIAAGAASAALAARASSRYVAGRRSSSRRRRGCCSLWYVADRHGCPSEFVDATPYVTTLLVLALAAQRLRMPKADGMPYRKGQGK